MKEATLHFFEGFYETRAGELCGIDEQAIDSIIDQIENQRTWWADPTIYDDVHKYINKDQMWTFGIEVAAEVSNQYDYEKAHQEYAQAFADEVYKRLNLKSYPCTLISPKEYNFSTDRIEITIADHHVAQWVRRLKKNSRFQDSLKKVIENRHTSHSGFYSFYSDELQDWLDKGYKDFDNNELGSLIEALLDYEGEDDISEVVYDDLQCNGFSDQHEPDLERITWEEIRKVRNMNENDEYFMNVEQKYLKGKVMNGIRNQRNS